MFRWLVLLLILLFVYHVREVFPPFIVGAVVAYLLHPLVSWLSLQIINLGRVLFSGVFGGLLVRLIAKCSTLIAVGVIFLLCLSVAGILLAHFLPDLTDQATKLVDNRQEIVTNLVSQLSQVLSLNLDVEKVSKDLFTNVESAFGKPEEIVHVGSLISKSLLSILVCLVSSIYLLVDNKRVGRFFLRFMPPEKRATVVILASQMNVMLSKYVTGQLLLIVLMSFIAGFILTFFKIKYWLLIAIATGVLEIIPVLGPFLAIVIASVFAIAQLGLQTTQFGLPSALWIPLCYWMARLFEDYVVVPNTIGHAVELHPLAVIFAVIVGEQMAGALGMLIAIPVAASIKVLLDFWYPPEPSDVEQSGHSHHRSPLAWLQGNRERPDHGRIEGLTRSNVVELMSSGQPFHLAPADELTSAPAEKTDQTRAVTRAGIDQHETPLTADESPIKPCAERHTGENLPLAARESLARATSNNTATRPVPEPHIADKHPQRSSLPAAGETSAAKPDQGVADKQIQPPPARTAADSAIKRAPEAGTSAGKEAERLSTQGASDNKASQSATDRTPSQQTANRTAADKQAERSSTLPASDNNASQSATDNTASQQTANRTAADKQAERSSTLPASDSNASKSATDRTASQQTASRTAADKQAERSSTLPASDNNASKSATDRPASQQTANRTAADKQAERSSTLPASDSNASKSATDKTDSQQSNDQRTSTASKQTDLPSSGNSSSTPSA